MHLPHQAHGNQSQGLELHYFPLDRQLCRIKILAEKTIEDSKWKSGIAKQISGMRIVQEVLGMQGHIYIYIHWEWIELIRHK
jgi:hypothetical protein